VEGCRSAVIKGDSFPPALEDLLERLRDSLDNPVSSRALKLIIPLKGSVSILVPDTTRGVGTRIVLPMLLDYLSAEGLENRRIRVVIAGGAHRTLKEPEIRAHLGDRVYKRYEVIQHKAGGKENVIDIGTTSYGTPVRINRMVAESSLIISLGPVSFHYFAGFGGGRKLIMPGVAGMSSIMANHRLSLKDDPGEGLAEGCGAGNLEGNRVSGDMVEAVRILGLTMFAVNYVMNPDDEISFLNAGDIEDSHLAACSFLRREFSLNLNRKYGTVIASAGGAPKDLNLLQVHKAVRLASRALRTDGKLYFIAACPEGVGSDSYERAFSRGVDGVTDIVRSEYTLNSQTAISTSKIVSRVSVYLMSGIDDSIVRRFGFIPWKEPFAEALSGEGESLIINNASYFLPEI